MNEQERYAGNLTLVGGRLCLDFANTVDWHASDQPEELINSYADWVAWSRHVKIITAHEARHLLQAAAQSPAQAAQALEHAVEVREGIYRIFSAIAAERSPDAADVALLNNVLPQTLAHLRLRATGNSFDWQYAHDEHDLERMLWPIIRSAADVLTGNELHLVRECEGEGCGWLFLDTSKNHTRRWCTMASCGNRAKARRHYQRRRGTL